MLPAPMPIGTISASLKSPESLSGYFIAASSRFPYPPLAAASGHRGAIGAFGRIGPVPDVGSALAGRVRSSC